MSSILIPPLEPDEVKKEEGPFFVRAKLEGQHWVLYCFKYATTGWDCILSGRNLHPDAVSQLRSSSGGGSAHLLCHNIFPYESEKSVTRLKMLHAPGSEHLRGAGFRFRGKGTLGASVFFF